MKNGYVYIVTNKPFGTLYIGVTSDIARRAYEHKYKLVEGFSKRYGLTRLVYVEACDTVLAAIAREKQLKEWRRNWKLRLIIEQNPEWVDLYDNVMA